MPKIDILILIPLTFILAILWGVYKFCKIFILCSNLKSRLFLISHTIIKFTLLIGYILYMKEQPMKLIYLIYLLMILICLRYYTKWIEDKAERIACET